METQIPRVSRQGSDVRCFLSPSPPEASKPWFSACVREYAKSSGVGEGRPELELAASWGPLPSFNFTSNRRVYTMR